MREAYVMLIKRSLLPACLREFFSEHRRAALAFSGGADSACLLYAAAASGADVKAYCFKSAFQLRLDTEDAIRLGREISADVTVVEADILSRPEITDNGRERCYHCKKFMLGRIAAKAASDGFTTLLDGTNAGDREEERPGMRALRELSVLSPLRLCGLGKGDIRRILKEAEISAWDKPAASCLASRTAIGEKITKEKLLRDERAEYFLRSLGFRGFRLRTNNGAARLELPRGQSALLLEKRGAVMRELKLYYDSVAFGVRREDEDVS